MAERIVDLVAKQLPEFSNVDCSTEELTLTRKAFTDYDEVRYFVERFEKEVEEVNLDKYYSWYLISTYGKDAKQIFDKMKLSNDDDKERALLIAELDYCINNEGLLHPLDLLQRRTGRLYFDITSVKKYYKSVVDACANIFEVDAQTKDNWTAEIEEAIGEAVSFKS